MREAPRLGRVAGKKSRGGGSWMCGERAGLLAAGEHAKESAVEKKKTIAPIPIPLPLSPSAHSCIALPCNLRPPPQRRRSAGRPSASSRWCRAAGTTTYTCAPGRGCGAPPRRRCGDRRAEVSERPRRTTHRPRRIRLPRRRPPRCSRSSARARSLRRRARRRRTRRRRRSAAERPSVIAARTESVAEQRCSQLSSPRSRRGESGRGGRERPCARLLRRRLGRGAVYSTFLYMYEVQVHPFHLLLGVRRGSGRTFTRTLDS